MRTIPFSPPDIGEREIEAVVETLRSGWITTGPKTKQFEKEVADYCGTERTACINAATNGLELVLRLFGIGQGDEVITTPYTFAATANVILHVGAIPVFVDVAPGTFHIDCRKIAAAVTERTKVIIPVDYAGWPCDYTEISEVIDGCRPVFRAKPGTLQEKLGRVLLLSDAAHSFGARYKGKRIGGLADFSVFSFHAVKNLTTAEGGAISFDSVAGESSDTLYDSLMKWSLHGQNVDALKKITSGSWRYSIDFAGYKCNMTDLCAALGLIQLSRYDTEILPARKGIFERYLSNLSGNDDLVMPPFDSPEKISAYHLFPLRLKNEGEELRDKLIGALKADGVASNVHFIPLPLHNLYRGLGYAMTTYPCAYEMYRNEITLPLHSKMSLEDVDYVCDRLLRAFTLLSQG